MEPKGNIEEEKQKDITLLEFNILKIIIKREFDDVNSQKEKRQWKKYIFSLHMADYKKEKIWEYLNDDIEDEYFEHFVEAVHKGWFK